MFMYVTQFTFGFMIENLKKLSYLEALCPEFKFFKKIYRRDISIYFDKRTKTLINASCCTHF